LRASSLCQVRAASARTIIALFRFCRRDAPLKTSVECVEVRMHGVSLIAMSRCARHYADLRNASICNVRHENRNAA